MKKIKNRNKLKIKNKWIIRKNKKNEYPKNIY